MNNSLGKTLPDWPALLQKVRGELAGLAEADRAWLMTRVTAIAEAQEALDALFREAGGLLACAACDGECCGCGKHHVTLTNLLACLFSGEAPPTPDFEQPCPFLGDRGCVLSVAKRPYNCITFFCEELEGRLDEVGRKRLRSLDKSLRAEYLAIESRYPAATLRGLWIAIDRSGGGPLLQRAGQGVVK